MRSKLLVSTAALLAGMAMASAQNVPSGGRDSGPAAQSQGAPGGAAGQDRQAPQSSQGQRGQDTKGQAQQDQKDQTQRGQDTKGQAQQGQKDQMQRGQQKDQRGQAAEGKDSPSQTQQSPKQEQSPQRQQGQQGQGAQPSQGAQGKTTQQGQTQQGQTGGSGATLTTEERTKVREKVLTGGNVPRASNVNFSISVGTAVPRTVRIVAVPPILVEFHPQWRGYRYFVVGDDMIVVDRNNRIVAVIAL
jgi:Protein of unknown function (DUF1236)